MFKMTTEPNEIILSNYIAVNFIVTVKCMVAIQNTAKLISN